MYNSTHVYKNSFIKWELFQKWPYINKNYLPKKQAIKKFCLISFYRKQLEKLNKIHRKMIEFWKDKPRQLSSPKFWRQGKQTKVRSHLLLLLMPWDFLSFFLSYFSFIFISWRLITLQYCSGFCHTLTWISHGFTCVAHPDPPTRLPPHPIPLGLPRTPARITCLMHPTWAGGLFHTW